MKKRTRITCVVLCGFATLSVSALIVFAGVSVAQNGVQGIVGELLGNNGFFAGTDTETESEPEATQSEQDKMMEMLFDLDKTHRPSYRDMFELSLLQKSGAELLITDAVEIMGKPHGHGSAAGQRFFEWELDNGKMCVIYTGIKDEKYADQPTPWEAMLAEGYGGAYVGWISYAGGREILDDTLFDVEMLHKPSYEDYLKVQEGMTITEMVEILGKPHEKDDAPSGDDKYIIWILSDGYYLSVQVVVIKEEETYTEWDEILTENYGGAVSSYFYYSGPDGK